MHFSLCVTCLSVAVHMVRFWQHCCIPHESIICTFFLHVTWFYLRIPKISNIQNFSPPPDVSVIGCLLSSGRVQNFCPPPFSLENWKYPKSHKNTRKNRDAANIFHIPSGRVQIFSPPPIIACPSHHLVNNEAYQMVNQATENMISELRGLMELIYQLLYN